MRAVVAGRIGGVAVEITWTPEAEHQVRPAAATEVVTLALESLRARAVPLSVPGVGELDRADPDMAPHIALAEIIAVLDLGAGIVEQSEDWPDYPADLEGADASTMVF